jgi:hypothetical protein
MVIHFNWPDIMLKLMTQGLVIIARFDLVKKTDFQSCFFLSSTSHIFSESYFEDYNDAQKLSSKDEQQEFYQNMKSGAESGWDYSTRW